MRRFLVKMSFGLEPMFYKGFKVKIFPFRHPEEARKLPHKDPAFFKFRLIIFCWMFVGLCGHTVTTGQPRHFEGQNWLKDSTEKRGKLLLTYLERGDISCQTLWEEKEKGRQVVGTPDYDLPEVKTYCSARMRFVQIDSKRDSMGGQKWGKGNWKRVFDKEPVTTQKVRQQSSEAQTVVESFFPRFSPQGRMPKPESIQVASSAQLPTEELADEGFDEPEDSIKRPAAHSITPVKPIQWRGRTREIGVAQRRLEGVYEKTKRHMEEMHDTWKQLEVYECNRQTPCLERLAKLKRDLEDHIQGLEKRYVDSLERQNNFLTEELERHLAEDRSHLQDRVVEQLHAYLEELQEQNKNLAEKINALRTEGAVLVDSLEGRASHQDTEDVYEGARGGKPKGDALPQGPLKVKQTLDSLTARFAELQRQMRSLQEEIAAECGHTCVGSGCGPMRAILVQAQDYEAKMKELEEKIRTLQARVVRVRTPDGAAKALAARKIEELFVQVNDLETANRESMAALQAELAQAQGDTVTATQRTSDLEAQQRELSAKVATAAQTEASLRTEIAEVKQQLEQGHVTEQEARSANSELQEALSRAHAIKEEAFKTIEMLKKQKAGGKFLGVVQRALLKKAKAANDKLQKDLEELTKKQTAALEEIQGKLASSEAARDKAEKGAADLLQRQENLAADFERLKAIEADLRKKMETQAQDHRLTAQQRDAARRELESKFQINQERMTALERENASLIKEIGLKKPLLPTEIESLLKEAQKSNRALQHNLTELKKDNLQRLQTLEEEFRQTKRQLGEAQKLTTEQKRKIEVLEAQIRASEDSAKQEQEKAKKEAERAAVLEQQVRDTDARSRDEKDGLSALERRAQQAEEAALQHKQKAEEFEAKAQKAEEDLAKLERVFGINLQENELASLAVTQTYDQRLTVLVLAIETQKREMKEQKEALDQQADQLRSLEERSRQDQTQVEELQRVQKQQEDTLQKAKKMEEGSKRLHSGTGYVDKRALEGRIKELEDLLRKEGEEKKRASDIVDLQKLALSRQRVKLDEQEATMRLVEEEREKLEEGLRAQERNLQSQLKELEKLRDSKRESGQTEADFEKILAKKEEIIAALKSSIASAQKEISGQAKRIKQQRKVLSRLDKAHATQKEILATAYVVAKQLADENTELKARIPK